MLRATRNLFKIKSRLEEFGYKFSVDRNLVFSDKPILSSELTHVNTNFGSLPKLAYTWYKYIHSVDFSQSKEQLYGNANDSNSSDPMVGFGWNQPLIYLSLNECIKLHNKMYETNSDSNQQDVVFLPTGGYATNCNPKGYKVPCYNLDCVHYNDGSGDVMFAQEIRWIFKCAGFPYWYHFSLKNDFIKKRRLHKKYQEFYDSLKSDLEIL